MSTSLQPAHVEVSRWRILVALNSVSALAQLGQFSAAFALYPLALEARQTPAWQIGLVTSCLWIGNLVGLFSAPRLIAKAGYRGTVVCGLLASSAALFATPITSSPWWSVWAVFCGLGYGLRWIGNETWLFGILPAATRGRTVGFHESLLALTSVIGPALIAILGAGGASFAAAAIFTLAAAVPLWLAGPAGRPAAPSGATARRAPRWIAALLSLHVATAAVGGLLEGGLGLFPVFTSARGMGTDDTAWILSIVGLGGMLLQFPLGWLADARGVRTAIAWTSAATAVCASAAALLPLPGAPFAAIMFLLGGSLTGFLTLAIVGATQGAGPAVLSVELGRVSIAFTGMSALGPLLTGGLVTALGAGAVMAFTAGAAALMLPLLVGLRASKLP